MEDRLGVPDRLCVSRTERLGLSLAGLAVLDTDADRLLLRVELGGSERVRVGVPLAVENVRVGTEGVSDWLGLSVQDGGETE